MKTLPCTPAVLLLGLLVLAGCARREEASDETAPTAAESPQAASPAPPADLPPPELASIRVQVTLTPEAEARLQSASESVSVEVIFAGDPAPDASGQVNELGLLELGKATKELAGSGSLDFPESLIDQSRLESIVGQPQVLVNTRSSGKSTPGNLLRCNFYWETLKVAGQGPVEISCAPL
ncbi:hypothetical protein FQY83_14815 [Luteimonas marina]|uniref:Lipoprotein n=1 Tax=Luteimonas marina TaxID=488485 RepID=A0A5C5TZB8_9GAMM|nr:hypothetical protein [Luteimonas marina]TWT18645.1 hypothetical protein FQY83_14815 [Luteimonas marina]